MEFLASKLLFAMSTASGAGCLDSIKSYDGPLTGEKGGGCGGVLDADVTLSSSYSGLGGRFSLMAATNNRANLLKDGFACQCANAPTSNCRKLI